MVRGVKLLLITLFLINLAVAQDQNTFVRNGLLKATATISPGFLLKESGTYVYINGELEYFPEKRVSLRGDGYWMVGAQDNPALLSSNHTLLFGGLYHFPKKRFDCFIGLQPGLGFVKTNSEKLLVSYPLKATPVISVMTGVTYYVHDYFNFFINLRYLNSRYFTSEEISLNELRLSAGLGFQIRTKRE